MDKNEDEIIGLDDLNVQNVSEPEQVVPNTRLFAKGALRSLGATPEETGDSSEDSGNDIPVPTRDASEGDPEVNDPPIPSKYANPDRGVARISDKNGDDHPVWATQFEHARPFSLSGDVEGSASWYFKEGESRELAVDIKANTITNRELASNSVYGSEGIPGQSSIKSNIVHESIGLDDISPNAKTGTVTPGDTRLVTAAAVDTAIANAVLHRGISYGPMNVDAINALTDISDGSTVHVSGPGENDNWVVITGIDDDGHENHITVRKGEDLCYVKNSSIEGWYSKDAEFKLQQQRVDDPTVPSSGTTESISFIDTISQNENGDITPTKKNVRQASTAQTGVVQLSSATDSSSEALAATPKAVKTVKDIVDGLTENTKKKQTAVDVSGSTVKTLTRIQQNENGDITPTFEAIRTADENNSGLMGSDQFNKLKDLPTNDDLQTALGNKKNKQQAKSFTGGTLKTVTAVAQDEHGEITSMTFSDIQTATPSVSGGASAKPGIISANDIDKLAGMSDGANKVEASTNGNILIDGVDTNVYTHPSDGPAQETSVGDTKAQTPGFGDTFKAISATVNTDGHTTAIAEHTVKIPNAPATQSVAGLMSAADKEKLDSIEASADENQNAFSNIKVGDTTIAATSTTDTFELAKGTNTTLTVDAANKKITIDTVSQAATATPSAVASAGAVGTSTKYAREDHVHAIAVATGVHSGTVSVAGQEVGVADWDKKADIVPSGSFTENNFVAFDDNGNIKDSGHKHSDYKTKQNAVNDPSASGTGLEFISGISQDANGVISPSKKTVQDGTTEQKGVVQLQDSIGASESSSTTATTPKSVRDAINALDVNSAGGDGKYIKSISEVDGKIIPVAETADTTPAQNSTKMITSGGVYNAIDGLDATVTSSDGTNVQVKVTETNGKVSAVNITTDKTEDKNNKVTAITDANKASTTNYPSVKATVDFVNSSVATNTATFLGTFSAETALGVTDPITDNKIIEKLSTVHPWRHQPAQEGEKTEDNNDYVYVSVEDSEAHGYDIYKRFKYDGTEWKFEYELNHSSFTEAQWAAIVSGITSAKVGNYDAHLANTNNPHSVNKSQVGLGNVENTGDSAIPVEGGTTKFTTGGAYAELAKKQNNLQTQTAYTAKGSATKVPQITTNTLGQVTGITEVEITGVTPDAHTHGNITNDGKLQTTDATIASGDKLVITDHDDGDKVSRSSVTFDGSTTTKALTPKGTFETFLQASDIAGKADKATTVTNVAVANDGQSIVKTINGNTSEVAKLDGTYSSSNKIATQSTVSTAVSGAVANLDSEKSGSSSHVTVTVKETDGKLESVTVSDTAASASHTHGNITNDGKITGNGTDIPTNAQIVFTDANGNIVKSDIKFDKTKTNMALTQAGEWAEFNNNKAFSKVKVGNTTVEADASESTLELVAGSGITITPDATNDKVTVAHTNSVDAGTIGTSSATSGVTLDVPYATYDANGHITAKGTHQHTVPTATTSAAGVTTLQDTIDSTTSNKAATPKAVYDAIDALDKAEVGGVTTDQSGNVTKVEYISKIKEEDGIITATTATMDTTPTENSTNAVTSDGIWNALDKKVDVDDMVAVTGRGTYEAANHRLVFNDIIFDNIYPVVGKYGLSVFSETTAVNAAESSGDKEWLLDWRPYLIDMSAVEGETAKTPVAELKPGNWLRKKDGTYAPVCGITSEQKTALDGKSATLKFGTPSDMSGQTVADIVSGVYDGTTFKPQKLWEYLNSASGLATVNSKLNKNYSCAIEVEVTDGTTIYTYGNYQSNHIPAPWETTETKYSVFIGRTSDVYVIDGVYSGTSTDTTNNALYMRGLAAKPVPVGVDGFDPEFFRLRRTGISPGPSTTVGGKIRNFFYNYSGSDDNTHGYPSANAACFKNNGTYPRTADVSQYKTVEWCRACNSGGSSGNAIPVAEGGYHSLNAFLCSIEAAYKARDIFAVATKFSSGVSSNDITENGVWNGSAYAAWNHGAYGSGNANYYYSKFQCMEPQIAASLAAEMGLAANTEFQWNGGTWHYEIPTLDGIKTLADNKMNCRIYKKITEGLSSAVPSGGYYMLRCALAEGVNPVGDIWWYQGGGCEIVYETTGTGIADYKYSFYLEPDQSRWISGTYVTSAADANEKHTDNAKFTAETQYKAVITDSTVGGTSNAYCLSRTGYSPLRKVSGGGTTTGECCYQYRLIDDNAKGQAGIRSRRLVIFRGSADRDYCSPRCLGADDRPSGTYVSIGCAAQVLLA